MINIKNYLEDGANYKAQAILAILRGMVDSEVFYDLTGEQQRGAEVHVGRFENCREQGYVFTLYYNWSQIRNYAVYEHRNSDQICVLESDAITINTPSIDAMFGDRGKYDVDHFFNYDEIYPAAMYIMEDMHRRVMDEVEKENQKKEKED